MRTYIKLSAMAPIVLALAACAGAEMTIPDGLEEAAQTCGTLFAFDQVIQANGQGFDPERVATIPSELRDSAQRAVDANSEYGQLQFLIEQMLFALEQGDQSAVLDLVAAEGECEQLGLGFSSPN